MAPFFGLPTKTKYSPVVSTIHATRPAHIILYLITRIIFHEQYRSWSSSLCSFLHYPVISSLLGPNVILSTLFWNTLSLRWSLNARHQVTTPPQYISVYLDLHIFFWNKQEGKRFDPPRNITKIGCNFYNALNKKSQLSLQTHVTPKLVNIVKTICRQTRRL